MNQIIDDQWLKDPWIFAYGSLLWNPDFIVTKRHNYTLHGWCRRLCVESIVYRGTPEQPGLVFGLDHGGKCEGQILGVDVRDAEQVFKNVYDREMLLDVYHLAFIDVNIPAKNKSERPRSSKCLTFVVNHDSIRYVHGLSALEKSRIITDASGQAGTNIEYLINTKTYLLKYGIHDEEINEVATTLGV